MTKEQLEYILSFNIPNNKKSELIKGLYDSERQNISIFKDGDKNSKEPLEQNPNEKGIIDADHHTLKNPILNFWDRDLTDQTVKSAGADEVSWKEAMNTYYPKPSVGQEIKKRIKNNR